MYTLSTNIIHGFLYHHIINAVHSQYCHFTTIVDQVNTFNVQNTTATHGVCLNNMTFK